MSPRLPLWLAISVLATPALAAEIFLPGRQHIGDGQDAAFVPADPVRRAEMQAHPMHFELSQPVTVTAVRVEAANDLDGRFQVFIDDMTTPVAGTLAGDTYVFDTPRSLGAGTHRLWPDGGCTPTGFALPCLMGENDFGFDGLTLIASGITAARSDHRRRHLGVLIDLDNDYSAGFYPDAPDGTSASIGFTLEIPRLLSEIRFYRLRDVSGVPAAAARVAVDGIAVGTLSAGGDPFIVPAGLLLGAGAHTLTVSPGVLADDISWDDTVLIFANDPATTPGAFNAVDPGESPASGPLRTRIAGTAFAVDLVALQSGLPFPAYTGTVLVSVVDASNPAAGCDGWPVMEVLGSTSFAAGDSGRKTFLATHFGLLREARLRVEDPARGIASCSTDTFAIRPDRFENFSATHGDERTAGLAETLSAGGYTPTSLPRHRAGQPFTLNALAVLGSGVAAVEYAGSPTVRALGSVLGTYTGAVSIDSWTTSAGALRSDTARYDEVGALTIQLVDTAFAATDADDTPQAQREIASTPIALGRFVPDHFALEPESAPTAPALLAGCGGFTYAGQPLRFSPSPPRLAIKAVTAAGTVTRNYDGALYHLPASLPATEFPAAAGTVLRLAPPTPDNTLSNLGGGVARFELRFDRLTFARADPVPPFDADIALRPGPLAEPDGVTLEPAQYGDVTPGGGIAVIGAGVNPREIRWGRLAVDSVHGSERLPLDVPLRAEYWTAGGGFADNTADSCTQLPAATVPVNTGPMAGTVQSYADTLLLGRTALTLAAPNAPGQVWITPDLAAAGLPWLGIDADADGSWDDSPRGIATFGLSRNNQKRIYQREVVR